MLRCFVISIIYNHLKRTSQNINEIIVFKRNVNYTFHYSKGCIRIDNFLALFAINLVFFSVKSFYVYLSSIS